MPLFSTKEEMYAAFRPALQQAFAREDVAAALRETDILLKFNYRDPEGILVVDATRLPIDWGFDRSCERPHAEFTLSGDAAHRFFLGELNVPLALASRKILFRGQVSKALKLLPAIRPLHRIYREARAGTSEGEPSRPEAPLRESVAGFGRASDFSQRTPPVPFLDGEIHESAPSPLDFQPAFSEESPALWIKALETMLLIRRFEEHLADAFARGDLPTFAVHLSVGQEAAAAGACLALAPADVVNTTHRGHGHLLAKGADADRMMAELYGKATGLCGGKGGSMHVIDRSAGIMGSNGIVGAGILLGTGAGLAAKLSGDGRVSVVFFGDGATNQGMFHEGLNFAAVKKLPVVFVAENNLYGEFTPLADHAGTTELWRRAEAYGMPGVRVDGNDARAVWRAVRDARGAARRGQGPTLIECMTYRWRGHMENDGESYRTEEEKALWRERCPIERLRRELERDGILNEGEFEAMNARIAERVERAAAFAERSPEPGPEELTTHVYAADRGELYRPAAPGPGAFRAMTVAQAINETLAAEMRRDPTVFLMGEDVSLGGYFSVTNGLVEEFGKDRVIDAPISENAIVGAGAGAAVMGRRPVVEILFCDFLTACMDPIVNQAAKLSYMSGGQISAPMVIRTPSGGGLGMAAQHSQRLETRFLGVPGLTVVAPSDAQTAAGLLRAAIRSENPVLFVEHKLLYLEVGDVEEGEPVVPLRRSRVVREGGSLTVVGYSYGVSLCRAAAERLLEEGVDVEIVDLLTLYPLDFGPVLKSVKKTGRLLVVEEGPLSYGVGSEILARVAEEAPNALTAPPRRLAGRETPIPYARSLEAAAVPSEEDVFRAVLETLAWAKRQEPESRSSSGSD